MREERSAPPSLGLRAAGQEDTQDKASLSCQVTAACGVLHVGSWEQPPDTPTPVSRCARGLGTVPQPAFVSADPEGSPSQGGGLALSKH